MPDINISNAKGRDAVVGMHSVTSPELIRWVDDSGRQAGSSRFVKATLDHSLDALLNQHEDLEAVGAALIEGDPEIDLENTGRRLQETARVYVDRHGGIVRNVRFWEVIKNPDGTERERRPRQLNEQNVSCDTPLNWSGIFIPKAVAVKKFVFAGKTQLQHINGLTYDFLYAMAKDLETRNSLMLLGSGPKSNQPLILRRGSTPYRGFLEGRTEGDRYCLLLHLSNLELKSVPAADLNTDDGPAEAKPTAATKKKKPAAPKTQNTSAASESNQVPKEKESLPEPTPAKTTAKKKTAKKKAARKKKAASQKETATADETPTLKKKAAKKTAAKKKAAKKTSSPAKKVATKKTTTKKKAARKKAVKKKKTD